MKLPFFSKKNHFNKPQIAWCLFDFANSAFPTVLLTAFGGPFFQGVLVGERGLDLGFTSVGPSAAWGLALSCSMLLVTLSAPLLGTIADQLQRKRLFLIVSVLLCVMASIGLSFVPPGAGRTAFVLYVLANFAFEIAYVFYNAFLPELITEDRVGRLSSYGWALGYLGGLLALIVSLPLRPESYDSASASSGSNIYLLIGIWYLVFSIPSFLWLKDKAPSSQSIPSIGIGSAFSHLTNTLKSLPKVPSILFFLIAYLLYNDGITTVIEFTGIYTKEVLSFTPKDNIILFLILNVIAAPGALWFGRMVDRKSAKTAITWSLVVWIMVVLGAIFAQSKMHFWPVAILAAVVIGATQASSRALMAKLAPKNQMGKYMGLLALSGKASAIFGPTLYGLIAENAASQGDTASGHRIAIGVIGSFFLFGMYFLQKVHETPPLSETPS